MKANIIGNHLMITIFFVILDTVLLGQHRVYLIDSASHEPASGYIYHLGQYWPLDSNGSITLSTPAQVIFRKVGLEPIILDLIPTKDIYEVSSRPYRLPEIAILPLNAQSIIDSAFDRYCANARNHAIVQRGCYRELLVADSTLLKVQEAVFDGYQMPLFTDNQRFYCSQNSVNFLERYEYTNNIQKENIRKVLGKIVSSKIDFDALSLHSYIKQGNIQNRIFSYLYFSDSKCSSSIQLIGIDTIGGREIYVIDQTLSLKRRILAQSRIHIGTEDYCIYHFELMTASGLEAQIFLHLKTKIAMWLLGISFDIEQSYVSFTFHKNNENVHYLSHANVSFPFNFRRRSQSMSAIAQFRYALSEPLNVSLDSKPAKSKLSNAARYQGIQKSTLSYPKINPNEMEQNLFKRFDIRY